MKMQEELAVLGGGIGWKQKSSRVFCSVMDSRLKMTFSQHLRYNQTTRRSLGRKQMSQLWDICHESSLEAGGHRDSGEIWNSLRFTESNPFYAGLEKDFSFMASVEQICYHLPLLIRVDSGESVVKSCSCPQMLENLGQVSLALYPFS